MYNFEEYNINLKWHFLCMRSKKHYSAIGTALV